MKTIKMNKLIFCLTVVATFLLAGNSVYGQVCGAVQSGLFRVVQPSATDAAIDDQYGQHLALARIGGTPRNRLLIHLVGSTDCPENTELFLIEAAAAGFDVISVAYPNDLIGSICSSKPAGQEDSCYINIRRETIFGAGTLLDGNGRPSASGAPIQSGDVDVNAANSIRNRIKKLITFLQGTAGGSVWNQYNFETPSNIIYSGHSQGGGHAVMLAKTYTVNRVVAFASPVDRIENGVSVAVPAPWLRNLPSATPRSNYFMFYHVRDQVLRLYKGINSTAALRNYMETTSESIRGVTTVVETPVGQVNGSCASYVGTALLSSTITSDNNLLGILLSGDHSNPIVDFYTPKLSGGAPRYRNIWLGMMGGC